MKMTENFNVGPLTYWLLRKNILKNFPPIFYHFLGFLKNVLFPTWAKKHGVRFIRLKLGLNQTCPEKPTNDENGPKFWVRSFDLLTFGVKSQKCLFLNFHNFLEARKKVAIFNNTPYSFLVKKWSNIVQKWPKWPKLPKFQKW